MAAPALRAESLHQSLRDLQDTVGGRTPSDYLPQGLSFMGFLLYPSAAISQSYDDNIYRDNDGEVSDFITRIKPRISIGKRYDVHSLQLNAEAEHEQYWRHSEENNTTHAMQLSGLSEANGSLSFPYKLRFGRSKQARGEPGQTGQTAEPLNKESFAGSLGIRYRLNRVALTLSGEMDRTRFEDGVSRSTGDFLSFQENSSKARGASLIATYDVLGSTGDAPEHVFFAGLDFERREFDDADDGAGGNTAETKDVRNLNFLAGLSTRYKGLLKGYLGFGYLLKNYDSVRADTVGSIDYSLDLEYNVLPKATLLLNGERSIDQENEFQRGIKNTSLRFGLDYELMHDLYLGGEVGLKNQVFVDSDREDDTYTTRLGLRYLHSRFFQSNLELTHETRDSPVSDSQYDQNIILYRLIGQL
ncbi:MAG: outer membrane beta-barrel protein [Alphaproteobacteria bacterium]|nr:outer membrane beta-barrel protein [Alphaproteobacteria bacterium]